MTPRNPLFSNEVVKRLPVRHPKKKAPEGRKKIAQSVSFGSHSLILSLLSAPKGRPNSAQADRPGKTAMTEP